jgi:GT2 family glycosyltransferase
MIQISVIIPTCNRGIELGRCLEHLFPQLEMLSCDELIISDDGDLEKTKNSLAYRFPGVIWAQGPRQGPAANRNNGAKWASREWLLFVDDDLVPQHGFFSAIRAEIQKSSNFDIFEGVLLRDRPLPNLLWEAPFNDKYVQQLRCSAAFCIRASTFHRVGRFDERFVAGVYFEDMDFSARLAALGARKKFVPSAIVVHPLRRKPGSIQLAKRWEGMCIMAHDQGASLFRLTWNLPWHALRVIPTRFQGMKLSWGNLRAVFLFAGEWLLVLTYSPFWAVKWTKRDRSPFWVKWVDVHGPKRRYCF